MEVVWKPRALRQREQLHAAIARRFGVEQAHQMLVAIKRAVDRLERHPDYGLATDTPGLRVILVPRTPYRVFYRRGRERCEILRLEDARKGAPLRKKEQAASTSHL